MAGTIIIHFLRGVSLARNGDSLVNDGGCKQYTRLARIHTRKIFLVRVAQVFQAHIAVFFVCTLSKRLITSHASHVPHADRTASDITFTELSCLIFSTVPVTLACHIHSANWTLVWPTCRTVHAHSN